MGLHTGVGTVTPDGYVGLDVHRAARIGAAAHGGQIMLSEPTRGLTAEGAQRRGWRLHELGAFALKGLARSEALYQVMAPGLETTFPPPRARGASRVKLPARLTSLIGRSDDIEAVMALLQGESRIVTLTGPGGVGKSRIALAVAQQVAAAFPDGVFFVDLAPVQDPQQVIDTIASTCDIPVGQSAFESLVEAFAHRQTLLLLDNLEQVVSAGPLLAELVAHSPGLHLLVTSRIPLHVMGEREYPVGALTLPAADSPDPGTVAVSEAVQLFVERAQAVRPTFALTPKTLPVVAEITRRLDGLPLAIELAAARLRMLTVEDLAGLLRRSITTLQDTAGDRPLRHRTLTATIDWSYQLLEPDEQRLFRRLAVLRGGFTLEQAEAMWGGEDAMRLLESLIDKSLVSPADADMRFRMLATVREFGWEALVSQGELKEAADIHAAYFTALAESMLPGLIGREQRRTIDALVRDWENLRAAAEWAVEQQDRSTLVRLLYGMWPFLWLTSRITQTHAWLKADGANPELLPVPLRGRLLWLLAGVHFELGEYQAAWDCTEKSIALLEQADDQRVLAWAHFLRALLLPAFDSAPAVVRNELEPAISRFRELGDRWGEGYALITHQLLAAGEADVGLAQAYYEQCRAVATELGNSDLLGQTQTILGLAFIMAGQLTEARQALAEALATFRKRINHEGMAYLLEALAGLAINQANLAAAMLAFGAAEQVRSTFGVRPWPAARPMYQLLTATADSLDNAELVATRQLGGRMSPLEAAASVLAQLAAPVEVA
jgi:predicted ATPase